MLDEYSSQCEISDFGLAKQLGSKTSYDTLISNTFGSNTLMMEHIRGPEDENDDIGLASDIFSFGILMWQVCTERDIYADCKIAREKSQSLAEWIRKQEVLRSMSSDLRTLMLSCLNDDYLQRPSAKALKNSLEHFTRKPRILHHLERFICFGMGLSK
jgi:serine/threonine protein kinase